MVPHPWDEIKLTEAELLPKSSTFLDELRDEVRAAALELGEAPSHIATAGQPNERHTQSRMGV